MVKPPNGDAVGAKDVDVNFKFFLAFPVFVSVFFLGSCFLCAYLDCDLPVSLICNV